MSLISQDDGLLFYRVYIFHLVIFTLDIFCAHRAV